MSFHVVQGNYPRLRQLLEEWPVRARADGIPEADPLWGSWLSEWGGWAMSEGRFVEARDAYARLVAGGDAHGWANRAEGLQGLSLFHEVTGDLATACALRQEAVATATDPVFQNTWRVDLSRVLRAWGRAAEARPLVEAVLAEPVDSQRKRGLRARALDEAAQLWLHLGDVARAHTDALEALELYAAEENVSGQFGVCSTLVRIAVAGGRADEAAAYVAEGRAHAPRLGNEAMRLIASNACMVRAVFADPAAVHADIVAELARGRAEGAGWILPDLLRTALATAAAAGDWAAWDEAFAARGEATPIDGAVAGVALRHLSGERAAATRAWLDAGAVRSP